MLRTCRTYVILVPRTEFTEFVVLSLLLFFL